MCPSSWWGRTGGSTRDRKRTAASPAASGHDPAARRAGRVLIEIFLEAGEDVPDLLGSAQIGNGIGNGVVRFEQEKGAQFLPIQLLDSDPHIMRQHEIKKDRR